MTKVEAGEILGFTIDHHWFETFHMKRLTPEFCRWWVGYYDVPGSYAEPDEFYMRLAFAVMGWEAALNGGQNPESY